jgi:CheY-like chemotaxis protein
MPEDAIKASYSVLLVDDDKFLLDMYTLKFKESGCTVNAISDPVRALEELRKGLAPDVLLLDIVMPAMTGFEFLEKLRAEKLVPKATVIMLTNQGQKEDVDRATSLGAAGYIIKASSIPSEILKKVVEIAKAHGK